MSFGLLKSKKLLVILSIIILLLAPGSYAGASYYQSNKLIKEARELESGGDYAAAVTKYDLAHKKWKWNDKTITPKRDIAIKFKDQAETLKEGEANFGVGEWQKCLDYLNKVEKDFPQYSQAQNRYSDCRKKLDEEVAAKVAADAAAKKAEDDAAAAKAASDAKAAAAKSKASAELAAKEAASHVSDAMWTAVRNHCANWTGGDYEPCISCVNNNAACKASVDKIVQSAQSWCISKEYLQKNFGDEYNQAVEANCAKYLADPVECIRQYNQGR